MIYSSLKAQSAQCKWPEPFQKAFDFLKNSDLEHMEVGRYEIDGDDIYAMIQKQTTAAPENKKAESHYKYIDIRRRNAGSCAAAGGKRAGGASGTGCHVLFGSSG